MSIIPLNDKEIFRLTLVSHSSIMRLVFVTTASRKIVSSPSSPIRKRLKGCHYIDVRIEVSEAKYGYARNDTAKERYEDDELCIVLRVFAGERMIALGCWGRVGRQMTQHSLRGSVIMGV
jgi:hypothetical protein